MLHGVRGPCSIPEEDSLGMSLPFPCSIWSQLSNSNKVLSLEISSRTELIVVSENAHAPQKTEPCRQSGGKADHEQRVCLLSPSALRITRMLAGMSGLLSPV